MTQYNDIKAEYKMSCDGDGFGDCMGWMFPIAIELDVRGVGVPEAWQYRAGAFGSHHEPGCYVAEILHSYGDEILVQFGNVLARYQSKLHAAGLSY